MRSWFGLVHQISHYNQLTWLMTPFKLLLSPKTKFYQNGDLNGILYKSKEAIVASISKGVKIFDLGKPTSLQQDWFTTDILVILFCRTIILVTPMCHGIVKLDHILFWQAFVLLDLQHLVMVQ